jgi:hypothetical protein
LLLTAARILPGSVRPTSPSVVFFLSGISGIGLETAWNSMHLAIMPQKQPKRPNNNAKALENWESEGGAPASDNRSTKRKRPRDLNQITQAQPLADHKQKPKGA